MSIAQYALNMGLLAVILGGNLGTRVVTWRRLLLPVVLVVLAGAVFLRDVPTVGNDGTLEIVGVVAGVALGLLAGLLVAVRPSGDGLVMTAGIAYAVLWVTVIVGRMVFAFGAEHWFGEWIGRFSYEHQITGADAWTAAFVLMALTMVLTRVAVTATAVTVARRNVGVAVPA